jgi:hypothetical protein
VRDLERMHARVDRDDRAAAEKVCDRFRVERCRHHDDREIVARERRLPGEREREVGVQAALVELIDDHDRELRQKRIRLESRREDPFGRDEQPRARREATLEAYVPADLLAELEALLEGDALRQRARGHPSRLEQNDAAERKQRRRHARCLPRSGRRDHHRVAVRTERIEDPRHVRVDGERGGHGRIVAQACDPVSPRPR